MARGVGLMRWYTDGYLRSIGQPGTNFLPVFRPGAGPLCACKFKESLRFPAQTIPVTLPLLDNTDPLGVASDGYALEFAGGGPWSDHPAMASYRRYKGRNCAAAVQWENDSQFWSQSTPPPPEGSPFGRGTGARIIVNYPTQPKWTGSGDDDEGIWEARATLSLTAASEVPEIPGRGARWCHGTVEAGFALRAAAPRHRVRDGILLEAPDGVEPTFSFRHGYPTYDDEYWGPVRTRFESHLRSAFTGQLMPFIAMRLTLPDVAPRKEQY